MLNAAELKAVTRLRELKRKSTSKTYASGEKAGSKFALVEVGYHQIESLVSFRAESGNDFFNRLVNMPFRNVAKLFVPDGDGSPSDRVRAFEERMRTENGDDIDLAEWVAGFIDGAVRVYARLAGEVNRV